MSAKQQQRLKELINLLRDNELTTTEIGERLGITRQGALKDIRRLQEDDVPVIELDDNRYTIDGSYYHRINLTLAQAWFLYLPLRRIVRAAQNRFPLARRLFHEITHLVHEEIAEQLTPEYDRQDVKDERHFQDLVKAWEQQCHVRLRYRKLNADNPTTFVFAPWWFEPAVWSDAFYVIGGIRQKDGTYEQYNLKIERIRSVELLKDDHFQPPLTGELLEGITKTWGIWMGEGEPVRVRLRFHNRQLDRLNESQWHPSQQIKFDEERDGSIIWEGYVSEPQEMLPWIRGWGADVEVLEPVYIREQVIKDVEAMAQLYEIKTFEEDDDDIF
jgi:predicted DNA-binding transcriptional regulator YafY